MDLEMWMTRSETPTLLQLFPRSERRSYIYHSMYGLVSGLSYLHREHDGLITSHHDLKPSNILVIGQDFKIADLGRSRLRPADGGSETEGANGLGTYEYQLPEYWSENGSRAKIRHGRAFDMWAMGCILIELATLAVHDWESKKIEEFQQNRAINVIRNRPKVAENRNYPDSSFHNNWVVVEKWVMELRQHPRSSKLLEETLDLALEMLAHEPRSRCYSWEAELDLYNIQHASPSQMCSMRNDSVPVQPFCKGDVQESVLNGVQTPLHRAALKENRKRMLALLDSGWRMSVQDKQGQTALDIVKRSADESFRESFHTYLGQGVDARSTSHGTALLQAAESGDDDALGSLLRRGVDTLAVDSKGQSSLILATVQGHVLAIEALMQSKIEQQLLVKDRIQGNAALHQAILRGQEEIVKELLMYSPDVEDRQHEGKTPLFLAVEASSQSLVKILLDHVPRAQVFTQCNTGDTPIHKAISLDLGLLELLLTAEDSTSCLEHKNQHGETPVWLVLRHERFQAFRVLKERGASLRVGNSDQDNLLHLVSRQRLYDFLNHNLHAFDAADIEARNRWNDTPLTIADRSEYPEIADLLRKYYTGKMIPTVVDGLGSIGVPSKNRKLFYTLGSEADWIRVDSRGYWRHLTYKSYKVYESICQFAGVDEEHSTVQFSDFIKQFNLIDPRPETVEFIWRRLLSSPASDVRNTSHPRPFILAILYMLHIERFSNERPRGDTDQLGEIKVKRRKILKRYDVWVPCTSAITSEYTDKCRVVQVLAEFQEASFFQHSRQEKDYQLWKSLLTKWKKAESGADT
ncbi:MAG: hypothetical protein Q9213_007079 [Squamulea squamosa]